MEARCASWQDIEEARWHLSSCDLGGGLTWLTFCSDYDNYIDLKLNPEIPIGRFLYQACLTEFNNIANSSALHSIRIKSQSGIGFCILSSHADTKAVKSIASFILHSNKVLHVISSDGQHNFEGFVLVVTIFAYRYSGHGATCFQPTTMLKFRLFVSGPYATMKFAYFGAWLFNRIFASAFTVVHIASFSEVNKSHWFNRELAS
ncbi:hypothetical protein E2542_SST01774 [Spatholobus suberectus]|nr:hypothetical protein E2542_SST01774 [Spatholobus suberectus]